MNMINILFILFINHYTGVTTWAYELIKGLKQFNVDVIFVSSDPYFISNKEYIKDISLHSNVIESLDYSINMMLFFYIIFNMKIFQRKWVRKQYL
jgi:hypothetical protein